MKLSEDIKPISFLKAHVAEIMDELAEHHRPLVITQHGKARAVLMDVESYDQMKESLAMLALLAQSESDIRQDRLIDHEKLFSDLSQKYFPS